MDSEVQSRGATLDRFGAFSFVDRITEIVPGTRARGGFTVPARLSYFSSALAAEAVGQLAAWAAMAQAEFRKRPVAALAAEIRMRGEAVPGRRLELGVEVDSCDQATIVYDGWAEVDGARVIELRRCIGPLLPMEDFDAPEAVRLHLETLCGPGAHPGRFPGVPEPDIVVVSREAGKRLHATLQVPTSARFFADHFPRRAVFPATLLLDAEIRLAVQLGAEVLQQPAKAHRLENVKLRSFVLPGQGLEIRADTLPRAGGAAWLALTAHANGKRIATARVEMVAA